jgi:hypothetical protein
MFTNNKPELDPDARVTVEQAAKELGISVRTIWEGCREGANPQLKHRRGPGGRIEELRRGDVYAWREKGDLLYRNRSRARRGLPPLIIKTWDGR